MKNKLLLFFAVVLGLVISADAKNRKSYSTKSYTPKPMYSGYGKVSKSTGRIKTKVSGGYFKPGTGKWVHSYARS